jgi:ABC-type glycerol-3-phosphate transport system substrate-binding protein
MRFFTKAALAIAMITSLAACGTLQTIADASVSPKLVVAAAQTFDGVEKTATNYVVACTPSPQPAGCSDAVIQQLKPAIKSGREARDTLEAFLIVHPGQLGSKGTYDALVAANKLLTGVLSNYQTGG